MVRLGSRSWWNIVDLQLAIFQKTLRREGLRGLQFLKEFNTPGNKRYLVSLLRWQCDGISFIKDTHFWEASWREAVNKQVKEFWWHCGKEKKLTNNKPPLQDILRYCLVANTVMRRETPKVTTGLRTWEMSAVYIHTHTRMETFPPVGEELSADGETTELLLEHFKVV